MREPGVSLVVVVVVCVVCLSGVKANKEGHANSAHVDLPMGALAFAYPEQSLSISSSPTPPNACVMTDDDVSPYPPEGVLNVEEDAPMFVFSNALVNITAGPGGEDDFQEVMFSVFNDHPSLFAVQPTVNDSGTLIFELAPNANGRAEVTLLLEDTGGFPNAVSCNRSFNRTFFVQTIPLNDPPTWAGGHDLYYNLNIGPVVVPAWAFSIFPGPADEMNQTVSFSVTTTGPAGLFTAQPSVSPDGTLSFESAPNAYGDASFEVTLFDNGGNYQSVPTPATFSITVWGLPTITAVSPTTGSTSGYRITISGTLFRPPYTYGISATVAGVACVDVVYEVEGQLTCWVQPEIGVGKQVDVLVDGLPNTAQTFFVAFLPPSIDRVEPAFGPNEGGAVRSLVGSNFGVDNSFLDLEASSNRRTRLLWNGVECVLLNANATHIQFLTPKGVPGQSNSLQLTVGGQTATADASFEFFVVPPRWATDFTPAVSNVSFSSMDVSWEAAVGTHEAPVDHYEIDILTLVFNQTRVHEVLGNVTSYQARDLVMGELYSFIIYPHNEGGAGQGRRSPDTVAAGTLYPLSTPVVINTTKGGVVLTWSDSNPPDSAVVKHRVQQRIVAIPVDTTPQACNCSVQTNWTDSYPQPTGIVSQWSVGRLIPGATYEFRAASMNIQNTLAWSEATLPTLASDLPQPVAPPVIDYDATSCGATTVTVLHPDGGGSPLQSFMLEALLQGETAWAAGVPSSLAAASAGSVTQYSLSSLVPGGLYTFRVKATNVVGAGAFGPPSLPLRVAGAPGAVVAAQIQLSIAARTVGVTFPTPTKGCIEIETYVSDVRETATPAERPLRALWRNVSATQVTFRPGPGFVGHTSATILVDGLEPFTHHSFRVKAANEIKFSPEYAVVEFKTLADVPQPPKQPETSAASEASIEVRWNVPYDNGSPVTGYHVQAACFSCFYSNVWYDTIEQPSGLALAVEATGWQGAPFETGVLYKFRVRAINAIGGGAFSPESDRAAAALSPNPPDAFSIAPVSASDRLDVSWNEPSVTRSDGSTGRGDGGNLITEYLVQISRLYDLNNPTLPGSLSKPNSTGWTNWTTLAVVPSPPNNPIGGALSTSAQGLTSGTTYRLRARTHNNAGFSDWSPTAQATTQAGKPNSPGAPLACCATKNSVFVEWETPYSGGSPITGYSLEYQVEGGTEWTFYPFPTSQEPTATSIRVQNLASGVLFVFRVFAYTFRGAAPPSPASNPVYTAVVPSTPLPPVVGIITTTTVHLSWNVPDNGGIPILSYEVETSRVADRSANITTWTPVQLANSSDPLANSGVIAGLVTGGLYYFRVRAQNNVNFGAFSNPSAIVFVATVPDVPTNTRPENVAKQSMEVVFNAPTRYVGTDVTAFEVQSVSRTGTGDRPREPLSPADNAAWVLVGRLNVPPALPARLFVAAKGLTPGYEYAFRVRSCNILGCSTVWGVPSNFTLAAEPPPRPAQLLVSLPTQNSLFVQWKGVAESGATPLEWALELAVYNTTTQTVGPWYEPSPSVYPYATLSATVSGLVLGSTYTFRIRVRNVVGWSDFSVSSIPRLVAVPPPAPARPLMGQVFSSNSSIQVTLTVALRGVGGAPVTQLLLEQSFSAVGVWTRVPVSLTPIVVRNIDFAFFKESARGYLSCCANTTNDYAVMTIKLRDLVPGSYYHFRVAAVNLMGAGEFSEQSQGMFSAFVGHWVETFVDTPRSDPAPSSLYPKGFPLNTFFHDSKFQSLYLDADMALKPTGPGPMFISGIAFRVLEPPARDLENVRIGFKLSTSPVLEPGFVDVPEGDVRYFGEYIAKEDFVVGNWYLFKFRDSFEKPEDSGTNLIVEYSLDGRFWSNGGVAYIKPCGSFGERSVVGTSDSLAGPYPFVGRAVDPSLKGDLEVLQVGNFVPAAVFTYDTSKVGCDGVDRGDGTYAKYDRCLVCEGTDECVGCDNVPFSGLVYDACGVCNGGNVSCTGCDGVLFSGAEYDYCYECSGDYACVGNVTSLLSAAATTFEGTPVSLLRPSGIVIDNLGTTYVVDTGRHRIVHWDFQEPALAYNFAGGATSGFRDGPGSAALFTSPQGITGDFYNNLVIADTGNHRLRLIQPSGIVTTLAGNEPGYADAVGTDARFRSPCCVAYDSGGSVWVADTGNFRVRKVLPTGEVSTIAGGNQAGYVDGSGGSAMFTDLAGIAVDSLGNTYVSDAHRIRRISPAGIVSTLAGGGNAGWKNGLGKAARFSSPKNMVVDSEDNLVIADYGNNVIRKILVADQARVQTIAGNSLPGLVDSDDPKGSQFRGPKGVAIDRDRNVTVVDSDNNRVRNVAIYPPKFVVPPEWVCSAWNYGNNDGCDCNCGSTDPDCEELFAPAQLCIGQQWSDAAKTCVYCPISSRAPEGKRPVSEWTKYMLQEAVFGANANVNLLGTALHIFGDGAMRVCQLSSEGTAAETDVNTTSGSSIVASLEIQCSERTGASFDAVWNRMKALTVGVSSDTVGQLLYSVGGLVPVGDGSYTHDNLTAVSRNSQQWILLTSVPRSLYPLDSDSAAIAAVNGDIFVFKYSNTPEAGQVARFVAGQDATGVPQQGVWTLMGSLPRFRSGFQVAVLNSYVHVIGGVEIFSFADPAAGVPEFRKPVQEVWSFAPGDVQPWSYDKLPPLIEDIPVMSTMSVDSTKNELFVVDPRTRRVLQYTTARDSWYPITVIPKPMNSPQLLDKLGAVVVYDRVAINFGFPLFALTPMAEPDNMLFNPGCEAFSGEGWNFGTQTELCKTNSPGVSAKEASGFFKVVTSTAVSAVYQEVDVSRASGWYARNQYFAFDGWLRSHVEETLEVVPTQAATITVQFLGRQKDVLETVRSPFVVTTAWTRFRFRQRAPVDTEFILIRLECRLTPKVANSTETTAQPAPVAVCYFDGLSLILEKSHHLFVAHRAMQNILDPPMSSLRQAVNFAAEGDIIWQLPGRYKGEDNLNIGVYGRSYSLVALSGVAYTRVDALFRGTPFRWENFGGAYTVVEGVTVTRGFGVQGGGAYVRNAAPNLVQVNFFDNYAQEGAALYGAVGSAPRLSQSSFFRNLATRRGGGLYLTESAASLTQCSVEENRASFGSAMFIKDSSGQLTTLAGNGTFGLGGGVGTHAQFQQPVRVVVDSHGSAILTDNLVLRKVSRSGVVTVIAGDGVKGHQDGAALSARFSYPKGLAVDSKDNLYIADTENSCIRFISPNGMVSTLAGSTDQVNGWRDDPTGANNNALFDYPYDLVVAASGKIYVSDTGNHRVRVLTPIAGYYRYGVTTLAGTGTPGYVDSALLSSAFYSPTGIRERDGVLYVVDRDNHAIRVLAPNAGDVRTLVGSLAGYRDGKGSEALFNTPSALAWDIDGNLVVADTGNNRLRRVTVGGDSSTIAGGDFAGYKDGNVIAKDVVLAQPLGVASDLDGSIIVVDTGNLRLRRFQPPVRVSTLQLNRNSVINSGGVYIDSSAAVFTDVSAAFNSGSKGSVFAVQASDVTSIASTVLTSSVVRNNRATGSGTSWFGLGAKMQFVNVEFRDNVANEGSCVYMGADSSAHLTRCTFSGNTITSKSGGTSFHSENSTATYTDCFFNSSTASQGAALYHQQLSKTLIKDCTFTHNAASTHGGVHYAGLRAVLNVVGSSYRNNLASGTGGAISADGAFLTISTTEFVDNDAGSLGGAVAYDGIQVQSGLRVNDCVFARNEVEFGDGGAVSVSSITRLGQHVIARSNFTRNRAPLSKGGGLSLKDSASVALHNCQAEGNFGLEGGFVVLVGRAVLGSYGCSFYDNNATTFGGAVSVATQASLYSENTQYTGNSAVKGSGGAVALSAKAQFSSLQDTFSLNYAPISGAGLFAKADTKASVVGSVFDDNYADIGAASHFEAASTGELDGVTFANNDARWGAAVYLLDDALVTAESCTFESNSAVMDGGAVYLNRGGFDCQKSSFLRNTARNGGAFLSLQDTYAFTTTTFVENSAEVNGGSMYLFWHTNDSLLDALEFDVNTAKNGGAGWFWSQQGTPPDCTNCTFNDNSAPYGPDFATGSAHLAVINTPRVPSTSDAVIVPAVQIEVLDHYFQRVVTAQTTGVRLAAAAASPLLVVGGGRFATSVDGVSTLSAVEAIATPGTYAITASATVATPLDKLNPVPDAFVVATTTFTFDIRLCRPGELQQYAPVPKCANCAPGTYNALDNQTMCLPCPAGTFSANAGQSQCTACSPGYFCKGGLPAPAACPRGRFTSQVAAQNCTRCPEAKYSIVEASSQCVSCAPNLFYNREVSLEYQGLTAPCTVRPVLDKLYPPAGRIGGGTVVVVNALPPSASQPTTFENYGAVRCRFTRVSDAVFAESAGFVFPGPGEVAALQCKSPNLPPPPGQEATSSFLASVEITSNGVEYTTTGPPVLLFTYFREPVITAVGPGGGPTNAVSQVRVSGFGFPDNIRTFGLVQCRFGVEPALTALAVTATQVLCPAHDGVADPAWANVTIALNGPTNALAAQINKAADFTAPNGVRFRFYTPPTVTRIVPLGCPFLATTTITLFGRNFVSGIGDPGLPKCRFKNMRGGDRETVATVVSDTIVTCRAPPFVVDPNPDVAEKSNSDHTLQLTLNNQDYLSVRPFRFYKPPGLTSITPPNGPIRSSELVLTITGRDFEKQGLYNETLYADGSRDLNTGYMCRFSNVNAARLSFAELLAGRRFTQVPEITVAEYDPLTGSLFCRPPRVDTLGHLHVEISVNGIDYTQGSSLSYFQYTAPVLTAVEPRGGPTSGDFHITVTGQNFAPSGNTEFSSLYRCGFLTPGQAIRYELATFVPGSANTKLRCTAPPRTPGQYVVDIVLNAYRVKEPTASDLPFVYYPQALAGKNSPRGGPIEGGTPVKVTVQIYEPRLPLGKVFCDFRLPGKSSFEGTFDLATLPPATNGTSYVANLEVTCLSPPVQVKRLIVVGISLNNASFVDGEEYAYYVQPLSNLLQLRPPGGPIVGGTIIDLLGNNFLDNMGTFSNNRPNDGLRCRFGYTAAAPTEFFYEDKQGQLIVELGLPVGIRCVSPPVPAALRIYIEVSLNGVDFTFSNKALNDSLFNRYDYYVSPAFNSLEPLGAGRSSASVVHVHGAGFLTDAPELAKFYGCRFQFKGPDGDLRELYSEARVANPNRMDCLSTPKPFGPVLANIAITYNGIDYTEPEQVGVNRFFFFEDPDLEDIHPAGGPKTGDTLVRIHNRDVFIDLTPLRWDVHANCRFMHRDSGSSVVVPLAANPRDTSFLTCHAPRLSDLGFDSNSITVVTEVTITLNNEAYAPDLLLGDRPFFYTFYNTTVFTEMKPAGGPTAGGTKITIVGQNFVGGMGGIHCRFEATYQAPNITDTHPVTNATRSRLAAPVYVLVPGELDSQNNIVCYAPAMNHSGVLYEGTSRIEVTLNDYDYSVTTGVNEFVYYTSPVMTALSRWGGVSVGGDTTCVGCPITITGTGFFDRPLLSPFYRCRYRYSDKVDGEYLDLFATATYVSATTMLCEQPLAATPGTTELLISMNNQDFAGTGLPYIFYKQVELELLNPLFPIGGPTAVAGGEKRSDLTVSLVIETHTKELMHRFGSTLKCRFGTTTVAATDSSAKDAVLCATPDGSKGQTVIKVALNDLDFTGSYSFTYYDPVRIAALRPSGGPSDGGGTLMEVGGSGLSGLDNLHQCRLERAGVTPTVVNGNIDETGLWVQCNVPPGMPKGFYSVRITLNRADWSATRDTSRYFVYTDPKVYSFSPVTGPVTGRTRVTIQGTGFHQIGGDVKCKFANTPDKDPATQKPPRDCPSVLIETDVCEEVMAEFISNTTLVCVTPTLKLVQADQAPFIYVSLNTGRDWVGVQPAVHGRRLQQVATIRPFQLYPDAVLTKADPVAGLYLGGNDITIIGRNFKDYPSLVCKFGTQPALPGRFVSSTEVLCNAPKQPADGSTSTIVYVSLNGQWTDEDEKNTAASYAWFDYPNIGMNGVNPISGKVHGSTIVTVRGTGLLDTVGTRKCKFGNVQVTAQALTLEGVDATEIFICTVPPHDPGVVPFHISLNALDWMPTPRRNFTFFGENVYVSMNVAASGSMSDEELRASVLAHMAANSGITPSRMSVQMQFVPAAPPNGRRRLLQTPASNSTNATTPTPPGPTPAPTPRPAGSYKVIVQVADSPNSTESASAVSHHIVAAAAAPDPNLSFSAVVILPPVGSLTHLKPLAGPDVGRTPVTVFGTEFRHDLGNITCRFANPRAGTAVVNAITVPNQHDRLICVSPMRLKASGHFVVEVALNGADYGSSDPQVHFFYYVQLLVDSISPLNGTVLGDKIVTVKGVFCSNCTDDVPTQSVNCRFALLDGGNQSFTTGYIKDSQTIICPSAPVSIPGRYQFAVSFNDAPDDFVIAPMNYEYYLEPVFVANTLSDGTQAVNPKPRRGPASGTPVTITGRNFASKFKESALCKFEIVSTNSETPPLPPVGMEINLEGTEIICVAPESIKRGAARIRVALNGIDYTDEFVLFDYDCGPGFFFEPIPGLPDELQTDISTACVKCPAGTYSSQTGVLACEPCPVGTYRMIAEGKSLEGCSACNTGSFAPFTGSTTCYLCADRSSASLSAQPVADNCFCPYGYYGLEAPTTWADLEPNFDPENPSDAEKMGRSASILNSCTKCDNVMEKVGAKGAVCDRSDQLLPELVVKPGYWRQHPMSHDFYACPTGTLACAGTNSSAPLYGDELCTDGYEGSLCSTCSANYGKSGDVCSNCDATAFLNWLLVFVVPIATIGVIAFMVRSNMKKALESKGANVVLKILLNFMQFSALVAGFDIEWRGSLKDLLGGFGSSSSAGDAFQIAAIDCLITRDYYAKLMFFVCLPAVCGLIPAICLGIWARVIIYQEGVLDNRRRKYILDVLFVTVLVSMFLVYPTVTKELLRAFECQLVDTGKEVMDSLLIQDRTVNCESLKHRAYQLMCVLVVLLYGLGIPLLGTFALFKKRKILDTELVRVKYGFLYVGYRKAVFWWEALLQLRKFALSLLAVFVKSLFESVFFSLLLIELTLAATLWFRPFEDSTHNNLEILSLLATAMTLHVAVFSFKFIAEPSEDIGLTVDGPVYFITSNLMLAFNVVVVFVIVVSLVFEWRKKLFEKFDVDPSTGFSGLWEGFQKRGDLPPAPPPKAVQFEYETPANLIVAEDSAGEETEDESLVGDDDDFSDAASVDGMKMEEVNSMGVPGAGKAQGQLGPFDDAEGRIAQV